MTTTVTLSVSDDFSRVLDAFVQKTSQAENESGKLANKLNETDAASQKLNNDLQGHNSTLAQTSSQTQQGSLRFTEFSSALGLAQQGLSAIKGAYENVITPALELSDQVRRLNRDIGATPEEASKLIYAAGQMGISTQTLTTALDQAIKKGHQPTIENLAKAADAYNAIQDPIQRTKFLQDEFGRSGAQLGELMQQGADGIRALGNEAQNTGAVLDSQGVASLHDFEMATKSLDASWLGLKVTIAEAAAPILDVAVKDLTSHVQVITMATKAYADGKIGLQEYLQFMMELEAKGIMPANDVLDRLSNRLNGAKASTLDASIATDAYAQSLLGFTHVVDYANSVYDTSEERVRAQAVAYRYWADSADLVAKSMQENQAAQDKLINQATAAGVAGTITKNAETYSHVLQTNSEKIADLRAEIAKYTAAQGENITVVNKGQYSAEQLAVAQERLRIAEERLATGHYKTQAALDTATLSVRTAQDAVDKMAGHMGDATTTTADYSKKIGEDQKALDELTLANGRAEEAMHKANKEFVFQELKASGLAGKPLQDLALALGLIDKPTYEATLKLEGLKTALDQGKLSQDAFDTSVGLVVDGLNGVKPIIDKMPAELQPATDAYWSAAGAANALAVNIGSIPTEVTSHINIYHDDYYTSHGAPGLPPPNPHDNPGGGHAGGANFVVPPGYPNDTYPMRVQSGEHVIVIPAGGGGGGGNMSIGSVNIHAAPGQSGEQLWAMVKAAAARELRSQSLAGAAVMGT
jgi:hypothetical protein